MTPQNQIMSFSPVVLTVPGRMVDLELKVTVPLRGDNLPVILLSHGHGMSNFLSSFRGYAPLVDFYAAQGFVVIQPTHQDSKTLGLDPNGPEGALFWKSRGQDMHFILEHLDEISAAVPGLSGRVDKNQIAAVGHSLGAHTVAMLAGMRIADPVSGEVVNLEAPSIKTFVILGAPGIGADLSDGAAKLYPVLSATDFSQMKREALVVAGDRDKHPFFSLRDDWRFDAYHKSAGAKSLLTFFESGHLLGGISGYDVAETDDENPQRMAFVRETTLAYILSSLYTENKSWENTINALAEKEKPLGKVETKLR